MSFLYSKRRSLLQIGALALVSGVAQARRSLKPVTISVGGQSLLYYLPLTVAQRLGYFAAEGLDVTVRDYAAGAQARQALETGDAHFCAGAYEHTLRLQRAGKAYRSVVVMGRGPQFVLGIAVHLLPHYRTLADLRGKRLGVSSLESSTAMTAQLMLLQHGVMPGEVEVVAVGSGESAVDALRSGQVDALCHADPLVDMLADKGVVRVVAAVRTLQASRDVYGGLMPAATLFAAQPYLDRQPREVQALVHSIVRALGWLQTAQPLDVINVIPEHYCLGQRKAYLAAFSHMRSAISPYGLMDVDGPATALRAMIHLDPSLVNVKFDLERTFSNEWALKARQRGKA